MTTRWTLLLVLVAPLVAGYPVEDQPSYPDVDDYWPQVGEDEFYTEEHPPPLPEESAPEAALLHVMPAMPVQYGASKVSNKVGEVEFKSYRLHSVPALVFFQHETQTPPRSRRNAGGGSGSFSSSSSQSSSSSFSDDPIHFGGPSGSFSSSSSQSSSSSGSGGGGGGGGGGYTPGFGGNQGGLGDGHLGGGGYGSGGSGKQGFGGAGYSPDGGYNNGGGGGGAYGGHGDGNLLNRFGNLDEPGPASVGGSGTSSGKGVHSSASSSIDSSGKVTYHVNAGKF